MRKLLCTHWFFAGLLAIGCLLAVGPAAMPARAWEIRSPEAVFDPALPIHQIPATEDSFVWLIAFEEASFIRSRIGDWLPCWVYKTAPGVPLRWQLKQCYRRGDDCFLTVVVEGAPGVRHAFTMPWTNRGVDGDLHPELANDEKSGSAFLTFTENDGGTRRLWLRRARSVGELKEHVKVSIAMPLWTWDEKRVEPLGPPVKPVEAGGNLETAP